MDPDNSNLLNKKNNFTIDEFNEDELLYKKLDNNSNNSKFTQQTFNHSTTFNDGIKRLDSLNRE